MTVTFLDPPGKTLDSTSEALDFSCTTTPVAISVGFGSRRAEERVYRDGAFLPGYQRSTANAGVFSIVRDDVWPGNPQLYVDEGVITAPVAALLPAGYGGALAQWSCHRSGSTMDVADRSGNGYTLGGANPNALADLIPGKAALCPKGNGSGGPAVISRANTPAFVLTGALTILARVCLQGYNAAGTAGYVVSYANFADGNETGNAQWAMVCEQGGGPFNGRLAYFAQSGPSKTSQLAYSNTVQLHDGLHHFCCIRRNAAGTVVDVQVDADSRQTTGLSAPTGGTTCILRLGGNTFSTATELVNGLQADVNVVSARLSDAQVAAARVIMMGL
jgi:hypothetical protein